MTQGGVGGLGKRAIPCLGRRGDQKGFTHLAVVVAFMLEEAEVDDVFGGVGGGGGLREVRGGDDISS